MFFLKFVDLFKRKQNICKTQFLKNKFVLMCLKIANISISPTSFQRKRKVKKGKLQITLIAL